MEDLNAGDSYRLIYLELGLSILSVRWAKWPDPLWWMESPETRWATLIGLDFVEREISRGIQFILGPLNILYVWKK